MMRNFPILICRIVPNQRNLMLITQQENKLEQLLKNYQKLLQNCLIFKVEYQSHILDNVLDPRC